MIYHCPAADLVEALRLPDDAQLTGLKLSLDGRFVELRIEPKPEQDVDLFAYVLQTSGLTIVGW